MTSVFLLLPGICRWELVDVAERGPLRPLISGPTRPVAAPVVSTGPRPTSTTNRTETRNRE